MGKTTCFRLNITIIIAMWFFFVFFLPFSYVQKLEKDSEDAYLNSDWADGQQLKRQFQGMKDIKWGPRWHLPSPLQYIFVLHLLCLFPRVCSSCCMPVASVNNDNISLTCSASNFLSIHTPVYMHTFIPAILTTNHNPFKWKTHQTLYLVLLYLILI